MITSMDRGKAFNAKKSSIFPPGCIEHKEQSPFPPQSWSKSKSLKAKTAPLTSAERFTQSQNNALYSLAPTFWQHQQLKLLWPLKDAPGETSLITRPSLSALDPWERRPHIVFIVQVKANKLQLKQDDGKKQYVWWAPAWDHPRCAQQANSK